MIITSIPNMGTISIVKAAPGIMQAGDIVEYHYTGGVQTFTAPITGKYYIEAYGGRGEVLTCKNSEGHEGFVSGTITLLQGQTIYIFCGGNGGGPVGG